MKHMQKDHEVETKSYTLYAKRIVPFRLLAFQVFVLIDDVGCLDKKV